MKISRHILAAAALLAFAAGSANAAVISLNFEGVNATYPSNNFARVQNFYNGGMSSQGTSGTNYGIAFTGNALALCLNSLGGDCGNTSRGGLAPGSDQGGLFFLEGAETFMNVAAGFTTGFSFNYSADNQGGSVSVFDGLGGTGNLLATLNLPTNGGSCPGYNAGFCPFKASGIAFAGTALSVSFAGSANQIVFDDVTFGSITPGIPQPSTYAMFGIGLLGLAFAARRKQA